MQKIISVVSQINGVGKTTAAVNLSASLAILEKKTLLVDCDPSGGATALIGESCAFKNPVACDNRALAFKTALEYLDFIPERSRLKKTPKGDMGEKDGGYLFGKEFQDFTSQYEYVIMDTPSSLGFITITAMESSGWVVIPSDCREESMKDLERIESMVHVMGKKREKPINIAGILLNRCNSRNEVILRAGTDSGKLLDRMAFKTHVPEDSGFRMGDTDPGVIALWDIGSPGAVAYLDFAYELINKTM